MLQISAGYGFALACAVIVIAGDLALKVAADKELPITSPLILAGCALYALSAIAWFWAMRHISLAQGAVAYTMFSLLALCVIGVVAFEETLQAREIAGIGCAVLSVILLIRFV